MTAPAWTPSQRQRDRDAYRRRRTIRSYVIALVATAVVVAVVVVVVGRSSGWTRTRGSFFDLGVGWSDLPGLLRALWVNLQITLRGPVFLPVRFLAALYVDVFRGLPLLIVLYLVGYGIPSLRIQGAPTSPFVLAIVALVLTYTAYVAEVFRAGIESVHPSQRASARALGLTYVQSMRHVVFPQAVRRVLPPLLNDFVSLQKDTSLVSFLGVLDVTLKAYNQEADNFKFVSLVFAGLIFVALTIPLTRVTDWVAARQGYVNAGVIL